jgi:ribosomal-protein-alanine N-acetyltransferase
MISIYETDRLIVRQWEDKDYKDLYEYASLEEVTKFLSFPTYTKIDTAKERIEFLKNEYKEDKITQDYAIELKEKSKVIGAITIVHFKKDAEGEIEIGYVLNPAFQGKGYMTEAVREMFKYIKRNQLAKRIVLRHDTENVKSGNVMKRAGMTFEGVLRKAGENNFHRRYDVALYSILEEEIQD